MFLIQIECFILVAVLKIYIKYKNLKEALKFFKISSDLRNKEGMFDYG
jgi:hypothetical protein